MAMAKTVLGLLASVLSVQYVVNLANLIKRKAKNNVNMLKISQIVKKVPYIMKTIAKR